MIKESTDTATTPYQDRLYSKSIEDIKGICREINTARDGSTKYALILERFQQEVGIISKREELIKLHERFQIVKQNVRGDIKAVFNCALSLENTENIINNCCTRVDNLNKIVDMLNAIQNRILMCSDDVERKLAHLDMSTTKIEREVSSNLLPIYKKLIKECRELYTKCFKSYRSEVFFREHPGLIAIRPPHPIPSSTPYGPQESSTSYAGYENRKSIYPILSLDGGGIRGIIPATMLVAIEEITGKSIAELFKLIGGTSTGGILALGLSKPHEHISGKPQYTAQNLLDMYTGEYAKIFQRNSNYSPPPAELGLMEKVKWFVNNIERILHNPKYKDPSEFFEKKLGQKTFLSSALTEVVVITNTSDEILRKIKSIGGNTFSTGFSLVSQLVNGPELEITSHDDIPTTVHLYTGRGMKTFSYRLNDLKARDLTNLPHLISRVNSLNFSMSHVARVTSAVPIYFPPVVAEYNVTENAQRTEDWLIDGGALQNNPALPCVVEALANGHKKEDLFVLSLGTGGKDSMLPGDYKNFGDIWSQMTQPYFETHNIVSYMIGSNNYHRFQYEFDKPAPPLDGTDPQTIRELEECGRKLVEDNHDSILDICKVLSPESFQNY
ncbi:Uncharacterized protein NEOC65_001461 [Neochlamydia sp. AcF65]|uniref:patatin-like phospholipase family protein n=1 Tax=Neochlamydia sp. AcF65 TaxID=2795735 RepID=UPI001BC99B91|nr:patatin-like phospholipase family protein [Neochlamydia sp. AcF65]MBS4166375.1 Uncharacterized protein [Neochlamydia sp. AcF65]